MQNDQSPLFRQGMSARVKLLIFVVLALALLFGDARFKVLDSVRTTIGMIIYPLQRVAIIPADMFGSTEEQFRTGDDMLAEIDELRNQILQDAPALQRNALLEQENAQLRGLLGMKQRVNTPALAAEILYDIHNNFINKIVLNRGSNDGIKVGQAVIDEKGIIGQVSKVWMTTSEVTLLNDRGQAIPVLNTRTGERSVIYGSGESGYLEMRFMTAAADVQEGDHLTTSGIDGVYPAGIEVAVISDITRPSSDTEGRILCTPVGGINQSTHVLVMLNDIDDYPARPSVENKRKKGELPAAKGSGS